MSEGARHWLIALTLVAVFTASGIAGGGLVFLIISFFTSGILLPSCISWTCFVAAYAIAIFYLIAGAIVGLLGGIYTAWKLEP